MCWSSLTHWSKHRWIENQTGQEGCKFGWNEQCSKSYVLFSWLTAFSPKSYARIQRFVIVNHPVPIEVKACQHVTILRYPNFCKKKTCEVQKLQPELFRIREPRVPNRRWHAGRLGRDPVSVPRHCGWFESVKLHSWTAQEQALQGLTYGGFLK